MESACKWENGKSSFDVCFLFYMLIFEYMSLKINHISHSLFIPRELSRQLSIFENMNFFFIEEIMLDIIDDIFSLKCDLCLKPFSNKSSLRRHMKYAHEGFFYEGSFLFKRRKKELCVPHMF